MIKNMDPILKRFLKGLIATMLAAGFAYVVNILPTLNIFSATQLSIVVAVLLAAEKALPQNG